MKNIVENNTILADFLGFEVEGFDIEFLKTLQL